ncbi:MAG TPA: DUF4097 family beta strand repeat-containing protein [Acidisarcina sp.]
MQFQLKIALASAALLLAPIFAFAAEGTFYRTLNVTGSTYIYVDTGSGNIHVSPGSDSEVRIAGHVKAGNNGWHVGWNSDDSDGSPDERVKKVVDNPPIQQSGSTIRIGKHSGMVRNVSIDYEITVPAKSQIEANSGSGDVRIHGIGGGVKAESGSGNIEASEVGGHVSLETGSGDIRGDLSAARDVKAHTGSGNVHLGNVQGGLKAATGSGNIDVSGKPLVPWKLEAGSGDVTLNTGNAHFTVDAETGSGNVHSDPPMTVHGTQERHHLSGDINGGGAMVRLGTGSGNITIH